MQIILKIKHWTFVNFVKQYTIVCMSETLSIHDEDQLEVANIANKIIDELPTKDVSQDTTSKIIDIAGSLRQEQVARDRRVRQIDGLSGIPGGPDIAKAVDRHIKNSPTPQEENAHKRIKEAHATIGELYLKNGELERERRELERINRTDSLTGVANYSSFQDARESAEKDQSLSIISFDGDNFGKINKIHHQQAGDAAIIALSRAIGEASEKNGTNRIFRAGGDEFVVIAPNEIAEQIIEDSQKLLAERIASGEQFPTRINNDDEDNNDIEYIPAEWLEKLGVSGGAAQTKNEADKVMQVRKLQNKESEVIPPIVAEAPEPTKKKRFFRRK